MANPTLETGYHPTLIGRITTLHADYYSKSNGFGLLFETKVATDLSEFCTRLDAPENQTWTVSQDGEICGGLSVDGQDLGASIAHLRWFILSPHLAGTGQGNALLRSAKTFCRDQGKSEIHLWTFEGLTAARHLYEKFSFDLVEQNAGTAWGTEVLEQNFVLKL